MFVIGFGLLVQNSVASSTLVFTFDDDVLYDVDNPDYDDFYNIRNSTEITGNYNATYSFENETGLTGTNIPYIDHNTLNTLEVINGFNGHDGVMEQVGEVGGLTRHYYGIANDDDHTYEWWWSTSNKSLSYYLYFKNIELGPYPLYIRLHNAFAINTDAGVQVYDSFDNNKWYHLKIVITPTHFNFYVNGKQQEGNHGYDNPLGDGIDAIYITSSTNRFDYYDGIGESFDDYYNIGDNIVPLIETNESIQEVDKFDFRFEALNNYYDVGDDNPSGWSDIENGYDHTNIMVDTHDATDRAIKIEGVGNTHELTGLEKTFDVDNDDFLNITWAFEPNYMTSPLSNFSCLVYSNDSTLIVGIYVKYDSTRDLYYYNGSGLVLLTTVLLSYQHDFNLFIDYNSDTVVLRHIKNGNFYANYFFPLITTGKNGLAKIEFISDTTDDAGFDNLFYIDYIGVYNEGISLCTEYGYLISPIIAPDPWIWDLENHNLFNINAKGNLTIIVLTVYLPEITDLTEGIIISDDFEGTNVFVNTYYITSVGSSEIGFPKLYFVVYNSFQIYNISINGVKLSEGVNDYYIEFSYDNVDITESYFYVDNVNRLRWNLIVDDNDTEYIQARFNIQNVLSENRSISFSSDINGGSSGAFRVNYYDTTVSNFDLPIHARTTTAILPQTKKITDITLLISDNDLDDNDICTGYLSNIKLIYNPDISITITTLNLLALIVPLIVMIVPPLAMYKRFGSGIILPMFILMSLICVVTNLIPVWLFFIIAFSSIGFLVMKKKTEEMF